MSAGQFWILLTASHPSNQSSHSVYEVYHWFKDENLKKYRAERVVRAGHASDKIIIMIIARLSGGLGNQMFQYAFGRSLAIKNETELKLDVRGYDFFSADTTRRRFALAPFNIQAGIASRAEIGRVIGIPQNDLGECLAAS